jgi:ubiquinone/menaquinone biosynthesis C-methylase UbiE
MSVQPKITPKTIETLADAVYPSFAMLAGMELDLFTPLKDGPLTADEIARAAGTDRAKTAPLLHALVAIGLLKSDGERFLNSPESDQFLVRGSPDYIGMRHHAYRRRWNSVLSVAETIRAGVPRSGMDYASMPADARESFYRGTFTECRAAGRVLARSRDFAGFRSLVDVGGGSGGLAIAMAEAWPNLTITIADLPAITPVAQRYIDEAGFTTRIHVCPTNVVSESLGESYDVAVIRGLFPVLTRDQIRSVLTNVYSALEPGGPLYVVGWVLDDSRIAPLSYATYNLLFVNDYTGGLIHTEAEHRTWLEEAGFEYVLRERSAPIYAADFILARKPHAAGGVTKPHVAGR